MVSKVFLKIFFYSLFLVATFFFVLTVFASYEKFSPGEEITISEFVYDDDFVATTTASLCTLLVYKPDEGGSFTLPDGNTMNVDTTSPGRYYKTFTPDSIEGVWPATMSCGAPGVDLAILDKTFVVGYVNASTTAIANSVWSDGVTRTLSNFGSLASDVWGVATSTFTTAGNFGNHLVANLNDAISNIAISVWDDILAPIRKLTSKNLSDNEFLATESYINTATSTIITSMETASSSLGELINTRASLTNQEAGWTVTLSDFGETIPTEAYQARLQVLNYKTVPTDADSVPTVIITDSAGTPQVPAGVMIPDSAGTYSYSYTLDEHAAGGVWETEVSVIVGGQTIKVNDYWWVTNAPADVKINSIDEHTGTAITAHVEITNKADEGNAGSDFYYVYCIVDSEDNLCGGDDDIAYKSETIKIEAQETKNLSLNRSVLSLGTYWFKLKARALAETNWAAASEQFEATAEVVTPSCGNGSCSGGETCSSCPADCGQCGGGGGGGGGYVATVMPAPAGVCKGADLNGDNKVNSVDFSILLYFWKTKAPFGNKCVDMNGDTQVNSVDFSILLYQWGSRGKAIK